ncbi:unnamed protein product [Cercospora beticola]|nr:unnamed protein product [Cercospora beticola]
MHPHKLFLIVIAATACNAAAIMRARTPIAAAAVAHDNENVKRVGGQPAKNLETRQYYVPSTQNEYIRTGPNIEEVAEKAIERRQYYVPSTQNEYIRTGPNIEEVAEKAIERRQYYVPSTQNEYTRTGPNIEEVAEKAALVDHRA